MRAEPPRDDLSWRLRGPRTRNPRALGPARGRAAPDPDPRRIPRLFCGKTTLEDLRTLAGLVEAELVRPPIYLAPQIRDLGTLAAWLCYANFLGCIDLERIERDYAGVL
jgi:hypothetical protein